MVFSQDLSERSQRWRQVEILCGCSIVSNPGIAALHNLVRTVGAGRLPTTTTPSLVGSTAGDSIISGLRSQRPLSSRMSNRGSQDDLLQDDDTHSIAASSHMTSASQRRQVIGGDTMSSSAASVSGSTMHHKSPNSGVVLRAGAGNSSKTVISKQISRESSKESGVSGSSGSSDDLGIQMAGNAGGGKKTTSSTSLLP